ncbi:MAG: hypothetical protein WA058_01000, partial [Minisyncoccia bacterium]
MRRLATAFALLLAASSAFGATYYIDYNAANDSANGTSSATPWKRAPGMVGFAGSYSHLAGDVFLFKGGSTWGAAALPLTIGYSGTAGNVDTYRVATSGEWSGSTGYALFDGEGTDTNLLSAAGKSYIRVSGIDFYRNNTGSYKTVDISNGSNVELDHNHIRSETWIGFYLTYTASRSNISIHHNDIESVAM